jgi:hypothetical protein
MASDGSGVLFPSGRTPERTRTSDAEFRKLSLYPSELRGRIIASFEITTFAEEKQVPKAGSIRQGFAGVEDADRVQSLFQALLDGDFGGGHGEGKVAALDMTDAVLTGDRTAEADG